MHPHTQFADNVDHNIEGTAPHKPLLRVAAFVFHLFPVTSSSDAHFALRDTDLMTIFFKKNLFYQQSYNTLKPRLRY